MLFFHFVLVYLGAGLGLWSAEAAAAWGVIGLVVFAGCGVWLWTRSAVYRHAVQPWLLLALYAILSGGLTAVARAGAGTWLALQPRYVTLSSLFWVSVIVVAALAIGCLLRDEAVSWRGMLAVVAGTSSIATLGAVSYGVTWSRGEAAVKVFHERLLQGRECVLHHDRAPDECLRLLNPFQPPLLRDFAARLEKLGRGPFAPSERERPLSSYTVVAGPAPAGYIDHVAVTDTVSFGTRRLGDVVASGWAMDPFAKTPVAAVLVVVDGEVMGRATMGGRRPDVKKAFKRSALVRSGWTFVLSSFRLDPGHHLVEAYALLDHERRIVKLPGSHSIEVGD